jgi:uncharacterized protein (DUF2062 family)
MKLRRKITYYLIRLFRIRQGNHQVALGFVLGFFPCWYPTFGVGPALSIGLSKLVRGNLPASVIAASLGSLAWPILFYTNYKVGYFLRILLIESSNSAEEEEVLEVTVPEVDYTETINFLETWGRAGMDFMAGAIFNSVLFSILGYGLIRWLLSKYRLRILRKLCKVKK